jgi:hypothetical protein
LLVVNLKTANALGLNFPLTLLGILVAPAMIT